MRLFVATLLAFLALASPAFASGVTNVSVDNTSPDQRRAARARPTSSSFTTSAAGVLGRERTHPASRSRSAPASRAGRAATVTDVAAGAASATARGRPTRHVDCSLSGANTIAAGHRGDGDLRRRHQRRLGQHACSPSPRPPTPTSQTSRSSRSSPAGQSPARSRSTNAAPTAAAGARTVYVAGFTTSATGALSEQANSRIDVTLPARTSLPAGPAALSRRRAAPTSATARGLTDTSRRMLAVQRPDHRRQRSGQHRLRRASPTRERPTAPSRSATTSDSACRIGAVTVVVTAGHARRWPCPTATRPTSRARGPSTDRDFTTSSTGALSEEANSRINVTFPAGTSFANWAGGTVSVGGTAVGYCSRLTDPAVECWLSSGRAIAAGTMVSIVFEGVTNPGTAAPSASPPPRTRRRRTRP